MQEERSGGIFWSCCELLDMSWAWAHRHEDERWEKTEVFGSRVDTFYSAWSALKFTKAPQLHGTNLKKDDFH